ncbi:MAG: nucleotide disphospho-sugar-binding domain-containing protein [Myxococcota bacterium]
MTAVPALQDTVQAVEPTLMMFTAKCLWAAIVAERLKLPTIGIHTNVLMPRGAPVSSRVFAARWPYVDAVEIQRREERDAHAWQRCQAQFQLQQIHTLDVLPGLSNCMNLRGELNLVYASELLQPQREQLDDRYQFVGPCYDERDADADPLFQQQLLSLPRPLIFVSLGSMPLYNERQSLFELFCEALGTRQVGLVMAVGATPASLVDAQHLKNVLIRPYVPQLAVLKMADLFVTHAGTNSIYEALLAQVPLLMMPQGGDQPLIAEQVEKLGLGRWVSEEKLTPAELWETVEQLLHDPTMRERVGRAGASLRDAGGIPRVLSLVQAFVEALPR